MITVKKVGQNPREMGTCPSVSELRNLLEIQPEIQKAPYQRVIDHDDGVLIDYGSHVNFILVTGISFQDFIKNPSNK